MSAEAFSTRLLASQLLPGAGGGSGLPGSVGEGVMMSISLCFLPGPQVGEAVGGSGSLEWLDLDGDVTASRLGLCPLLWKERWEIAAPSVVEPISFAFFSPNYSMNFITFIVVQQSHNPAL